MLTRWLLALALLAAPGWSCVPIHVTKRCQKMMDLCLKNCGNQLDTGPQLHDHNLDDDTRSQCVKQCHQICSSGDIK